MDVKLARQIVDDHIVTLRRLAGCNDWTIDVFFDRLGEDSFGSASWSVMGQVKIQYAHKRAAVQLDAEHNKDRRELLANLLHELLHVTFSSPWQQYRQATGAALTDEAAKIVEPTYEFADERMIAHALVMIETVADCSVEKLLKKLCPPSKAEKKLRAAGFE